MKYIRKVMDAFFSFFAKKKVEPGSCKTKYPILLLHGVVFRDDMLISSWGRIPAYLQEGGAQVYLGEGDAWASYRKNAERLKERIEVVLRETKQEKVNLIAHSKGGIDARYAISKLGIADKVASLTTISTPHRGTSAADIMTHLLPEEESLVYQLTDFFAKSMGDTKPESREAVQELTREAMKAFNQAVPDAPEVYYQSYSTQMQNVIDDPLFSVTYLLVQKYEGENDGMVSVNSAQWGNFQGLVKSKKPRSGISHFQITGSAMDRIAGVHIPMLYVSWVKALKDKGF